MIAVLPLDYSRIELPLYPEAKITKLDVIFEADKRGFGKLVHGVEAGNPVAVKDAIRQVVQLRERAPGLLAQNNARFAREYVIPRTGTMALT